MSAELDEALLRDLAKPLVAQFSPAEDEELFPLLSDAHFADPKAFADQNHRAGPLAFGLPELTVLMTPVLLAAMTEVVSYVVGLGLVQGTKATGRALRRLFGAGREGSVPRVEGPPAEESLVLTRDQWAEVHRIVERVAQRGGVAADQAKLIADAVVGQGQLGDSGSAEG